MLGWAPGAHAQTDEIQVYDAEITAPGRLNLTWHNNFTPSGRAQAAFPGGIVPEHAVNGVPEFAYGVTDWFEAGCMRGSTRSPARAGCCSTAPSSGRCS